MIHLCAEVISGLGEDTFWTWFKREFGDEARHGRPLSINKNDVLLSYSTLGASPYPNNTIALLWELIPEMQAVLGGDYSHPLGNIDKCAKSAARRVVASELMVPYYEKYGKIDVLPIGVDTDLFMPMDKKSLRRKYGIEEGARVGFWCGTTHPMKGWDRLLEWREGNQDVKWIIVWKNLRESSQLIGAHNFIQVNQQQLSELMNCADFFLSCGLLKPFFMVEWEAMACNLPMVSVNDWAKDFIPSSNPRNDVIKRGWDRRSAKHAWKKYIDDFIRESGA